MNRRTAGDGAAWANITFGMQVTVAMVTNQKACKSELESTVN